MLYGGGPGAQDQNYLHAVYLGSQGEPSTTRETPGSSEILQTLAVSLKFISLRSKGLANTMSACK